MRYNLSSSKYVSSVKCLIEHDFFFFFSFLKFSLHWYSSKEYFITSVLFLCTLTKLWYFCSSLREQKGKHHQFQNFLWIAYLDRFLCPKLIIKRWDTALFADDDVARGILDVGDLLNYVLVCTEAWTNQYDCEYRCTLYRNNVIFPGGLTDKKKILPIALLLVSMPSYMLTDTTDKQKNNNGCPLKIGCS